MIASSAILEDVIVSVIWDLRNQIDLNAILQDIHGLRICFGKVEGDITRSGLNNTRLNS